MTRYEWETIREAERNEMRQRQIRLGKRRKRGRDETFAGVLHMLIVVGLLLIANYTDIADGGIVVIAIIIGISGIASIVDGIKKWTL